MFLFFRGKPFPYGHDIIAVSCQSFENMPWEFTINLILTWALMGIYIIMCRYAEESFVSCNNICHSVATCLIHKLGYQSLSIY